VVDTLRSPSKCWIETSILFDNGLPILDAKPDKSVLRLRDGLMPWLDRSIVSCLWNDPEGSVERPTGYGVGNGLFENTEVDGRRRNVPFESNERRPA